MANKPSRKTVDLYVLYPQKLPITLENLETHLYIYSSASYSILFPFLAISM